MRESTTFPSIDEERTVDIISKFVKDKITESQRDGLVIGLSGGLDSAAVAFISARSVDKDQILGLVMPSQNTPDKDIEDAVSLAEELGIEKEVIAVDELIKPFQHLCPHSQEGNNYKLAHANLMARIRMMILYYHANLMNRLVVGTGNRTELLIGYFTKYGDGGVDILPLGQLYKTDVRKVASYLHIPEKIILKAPTAGLWAGQTDEGELGIKYKVLDRILYLLVDKKLSNEAVAEKLEISKEEVLRIGGMVESSRHKLTSPPVPEFPSGIR